MAFNNLDKTKRQNLIAIAITKLIHGFGTSMFTIVYQPFLLELTNSIVLTGLIVSIGSIMQFLPMPIVGKFSDKYNRKYILISSIPLYIIGLSFLILANSYSLYYVVLGIILYFLGFIINNLNTQFLVAENSDRSKGMIFGFMFFSYSGGTIAGSSFIFLVQGLHSKFYFTFFIGLLIIEGFIFTFDIFVYSIALSIYSGGLNDYYNLSKENIAFISLWVNSGNAIFQIPAGRITDRIGNKKTLILSQFFGLGFFFTNIITVILWMNHIRNTLLVTLSIGYVLLALSVCTFIPAEQIILTDLGEQRKSESYGIISFFRGIGFIPTGILGGLIVENIHYIAPFIFSAVGVIIELIFLLKFFHD